MKGPGNLVHVLGDNSPPTIDSITMTPPSGANTATQVQFAAIAFDPEGDPLYYDWSFGDNQTAVGRNVTHQFLTAGNYTVTLNVTDNQTGSGRPVSATMPVSVKENYPPELSIAPNKTVATWRTTTFTASASDPDGDQLRFTWNWGDESEDSVTTAPSAKHLYMNVRTYTLVLCADDLTGLEGHNVSAVEMVKAIPISSPPMGVTLSVSNYYPWMGQNVTFTGSARDPGGDEMLFNFTFGDGAYTLMSNGPSAPNEVVTNHTTHAYSAAGMMTAYMIASDGESFTQSIPIAISVTLNHPPVVVPQTNKQANAGSALSFSATATDTEGESLRYTWDFGDGSALRVNRTATHTYTKAGMYNFTVHVDDLTGLPGHNVSSSATASIAFNLGLSIGWNYVSLPLSGFGYKASTLGLATGDMVVDPSSPPYHIYIKGISPISADFTIEPSTGYWIWVSAAKTIHLYGSVPTTMQTKELVVGWNNVGFLGLNTRHASDIIGLYSGEGSIILVAKYSGGGYITYISGIPANDFLIGPGQACWIWTTGAGTLSYMP